MNQIEFKTDGTKNMKNKKGFLQGALCGALAMLLAAGLVSCGLKAKNSNSGEKYTTEAISSETDKKLEKLESLINQYYLKDVDQDELQQGIYEGYIAGLMIRILYIMMKKLRRAFRNLQMENMTVLVR